MISLPRITRLAAAHRFDTLLEDILANGRQIPLPLRLRLGADPEALPSVSLAFALQRFLELTLGPTPQALALAKALLDRRRPGDSAFGSPVANAAAVAALHTLQAHLTGWRTSPDPTLGVRTLTDDISAAIADALASLRTTLDNSPSSLTGNPLFNDEHDTLLVLWQLADHADIADLLDLDALFITLEDLGLHHDHALAPFLSRVESALQPTSPAQTLAA